MILAVVNDVLISIKKHLTKVLVSVSIAFEPRFWIEWPSGMIPQTTLYKNARAICPHGRKTATIGARIY